MNGTNTCDRCGEEYNSYVVLIRYDFNELAEHAKHKDKNYCKPCRMAVTDYGAYLTPDEKKELEPKTDV